MMVVWPGMLFVSLVGFAAALSVVSRRVGAEQVDRWVFAHRDWLPMPFLVIGLASRLGFIGTVASAQWREGMTLTGILLILLGESLRIWAVGIVGAATRSASTNARRLVQEGPYAVIRNPIYAGNFLLCLGLACFTMSWAVAAACALYFVVIYSRIIRTEERFLSERFGAVYAQFCRRVPRLVPRLRGSWRGLQAPFSLRELRKEYQTIAGIICAALLLRIIALQPWQAWLGSQHRPPARVRTAV